MKETLRDEIPVTKEGLKIYIREMEKAIKPIDLQFHRMKRLLNEANERFERIIKTSGVSV